MYPTSTAYPWTNPHQMHMQPWPYSYPLPHQYYHTHPACCNHCPYTFHPHYPPPFPPFPAPYSLPPQHYSVDHPRYDYHKNTTHHCCGCNHKEDDDKRPLIKQEPQADNKATDSQIPLLLKDRPEYPLMWIPSSYLTNTQSKPDDTYNKPVSPKHHQPSKRGKISEIAHQEEMKDPPQYPIMWIPSGYMTNTDDTKPDDKDKYETYNKPVSPKHPQPSKRGQANDKHEPVSLKQIQPSIRGRNGETAQHEQGNQFPFKIFWLPSKNDQVKKDTREDSLDLKANKRSPDEKMTKNNDGSACEGECETSSNHAAQKVFPVKQASTKEHTGGKQSVPKVIPVKQASANEEKKIPKSIDTMVNSDSVEKPENGNKASPKTSKLPPVCLRVDPLPKKKKSSRSPSPGGKERSNGSQVNSPKSSELQPQGLMKSKEEQSEGDIKTAVDHANTVEHASKVEQANHDDVPREKGDEHEMGRVEEKNNVSGIGDETEKRKVEAKKNLSEHEAALIVQSVYRGFEVRKSQPLKKLRQISEVKKQVSDLRNHIQDLEKSSPSIDGKKQVIIGETIMSLLLKLDTIQGLHPFVREVRKSVAKELVSLQEKLDSLTSVKSETTSEGTVGSPQQVMNLEEDAIHRTSDQAQVQTGSCENLENKDAESKYDDVAEACNPPNVEQQLEKSTEGDAIHDKFDQAPTESDAVICENHEAEATVPQEGCNTTGEPQLELHTEKIDQAPTESVAVICDNHEVEVTVPQEGSNTPGDPQLESHIEKIDQAPTECDEALKVCECHDYVEAPKSHEDSTTVGEPQLASHKDKSDQELTECDEAQGLCESREVKATELQEGGPQLESHEEKSDRAPIECDEHQVKFDEEPNECSEALGLLKENHEMEATELQEGCNIIGEPQLESHTYQEPTEFEEASELHKENHEKVEAAVSHEGHNTVGESHEEKSDQTDEALELCENHEAEATDNGGDDTKVEENTGEPYKNQVEIPVEGEDLVNAESMMHDDTSVVVESGDDKISMVSEGAAKANERDGRLMEENEKLRAAVEELMKAGNEQLDVIKELTGRVKDLERKLSKKKRKVKVNKGRRTRDCVV